MRAWLDPLPASVTSASPVAQYNARFPVLGTPGSESQTLTPLGRSGQHRGRGRGGSEDRRPGRGDPKSQRPVDTRPGPVAPGPDNVNIVPTVIPAAVSVNPQKPAVPSQMQIPARDPSSYFTGIEPVVSDVQSELFLEWQSAHEEYMVTCARETARATYAVFQECQKREEIRIKSASEVKLESALASAARAEKAAGDCTLYYKGEAAKLRSLNDDYNIKFMGATGLRLDEWDCSAEALGRLAHAQLVKDGKIKPLPPAPPAPPAPPGPPGPPGAGPGAGRSAIQTPV